MAASSVNVRSMSTSSPLPPRHLDHAAVLVPLVPVFDLELHALTVGFVFWTAVDEKLGTVAGAAEMALQVLPATVGLEGAVRLWAPVGAKSLRSLLAVDSSANLSTPGCLVYLPDECAHVC